MARRVSMPAADDLFRPTVDPTDAGGGSDASGAAGAAGASEAGSSAGGQRSRRVRAVADAAEPAGPRRPSGRVRHDEKMTVYVTSDELLDIEHARLTLRRSHGLAVDRGRLVREALALVLADLETRGADSALVQRLLDE
ncbi:hypothetical protein [Nocardioides xinjiangensis]|uniref:hypothetical protein n=1 Tax=Nocardioides xinjiangensis TaxID=2817376 RepID=UPI001B3092AA|nr:MULTISPECIES: hypothetical protein [unclassified Nocardioides]